MSAVDRTILDRLATHYAEYDHLVSLWLHALDACDHPKQDYEVGKPSNRHSACLACYRAALPKERAARTEYDSARKRQLDAEPRCTMDGCKRRGAVTTFGTLLCRAHFNRVHRAHMRSASGIGMFCTPTYKPADIRRMAKGES